MFHNKFFIFISAFSLIFVASFVSVGLPAQAAQCAAGQALCNGMCGPILSTVGATCGGAGTGHGYTDQCGTCVCSADPTTREVRASCALSSPCIKLLSCQPGTTFNACTNQCDTPYVLRNPSVAQGDYISVRGTTRAVETASPPEGSLFYNDDTNRLRVKTGAAAGTWKDVSGTTYLEDPSTTVISSPDAITGDSIISVRANPTLVGVRNLNDLRVMNGDMYLNSGKALRLDVNDAPSTLMLANYGTDNGGTVAKPDMRLTLHSGDGALSELVLQQGNRDRWSLSSRPNANFEIWRNQDGIWRDASLKIDNASGAVTIASSLAVNGSVVVNGSVLVGDPAAGGRVAIGAVRGQTAGDINVPNTATIGSNLTVWGNITGQQQLTLGPETVDTPGAQLSNYLTIRNMDNDPSGGLNPSAQYAIRVADEDNNEWFSVKKTANSLVAGVAPTVAVTTGGSVSINVPTINNNADVLLGQNNAYRWALSLRPDSEYKDFAIMRNPTGAAGAWLDAPLQISNPSGNVTMGHDLRVSGRVDGRKLVLSQTYPPALDRSERLIVLGDAYVGGSLNGVTSLATSTLDLSGTGATAINTGSEGGILRVGSANPSDTLRINAHEISTSLNNDLNLQAHSTGGVNVKNDLDVDGSARFGSRTTDSVTFYGRLKGTGGILAIGSGPGEGAWFYDQIFTVNGGSVIPITSENGGLKLAELANEDWDTTAEGRLIIGASSGTACNTVCTSHGLNCADSFGLTGTQYGCSATPSVLRNCWCRG